MKSPFVPEPKKDGFEFSSRLNNRKMSAPFMKFQSSSQEGPLRSQIAARSDDSESNYMPSNYDDATIGSRTSSVGSEPSPGTQVRRTKSGDDKMVAKLNTELSLYQQQVKALEDKISQLEKEKNSFHAQILSQQHEDDVGAASGGRRGRAAKINDDMMIKRSNSGDSLLQYGSHGSSLSHTPISRTLSNVRYGGGEDSSDSDTISGEGSGEKKRLTDLLEAIEKLQQENLKLKEMLTTPVPTLPALKLALDVEPLKNEDVIDAIMSRKAQKAAIQPARINITAHLNTANLLSSQMQQISSLWVKKFSDKHKKHYWKHKVCWPLTLSNMLHVVCMVVAFGQQIYMHNLILTCCIILTSSFIYLVR